MVQINREFSEPQPSLENEKKAMVISAQHEACSFLPFFRSLYRILQFPSSVFMSTTLVFLFTHNFVFKLDYGVPTSKYIVR